MNKVTADVMDALHVDAETATVVVDWMTVDFSECSNFELWNDARATHFYLTESHQLPLTRSTTV